MMILGTSPVAGSVQCGSCTSPVGGSTDSTAGCRSSVRPGSVGDVGAGRGGARRSSSGSRPSAVARRGPLGRASGSAAGAGVGRTSRLGRSSPRWPRPSATWPVGIDQLLLPGARRRRPSVAFGRLDVVEVGRAGQRQPDGGAVLGRAAQPVDRRTSAWSPPRRLTAVSFSAASAAWSGSSSRTPSGCCLGFFARVSSPVLAPSSLLRPKIDLPATSVLEELLFLGVQRGVDVGLVLVDHLVEVLLVALELVGR